MARIKQTGKGKLLLNSARAAAAAAATGTTASPARTGGSNSNNKPNGTTGAKRTPQQHSSSTNPTKSATVQPPELTDAERAKLKSWLDHNPRPFSVVSAPASRKRKRGSIAGNSGGANGAVTTGYAGNNGNGGGSFLVQADLFEDRLSVQYEVKPADKWDCLRRYKKFTVGTESIAVGQCILVKHDELDESQMDVAAQWKAKVLEVRALDSEHVYIRVAWLNRPEDLDGGRRPHHGRYELIPTNFMDVIDAMTVNGSLEVHRWDERDDDAPVMDVDEFFWRQSFDFVNSGSFSKLRNICIDNAPQNPDEIILQCANPECRKWMHVKCIAEQAVQRAAQSSSADTIQTTAPNSTTSKKTPRKKPSAAAAALPESVRVPASSQAQAKAKLGSLTAEVLIKDLPSGAQRRSSGSGADDDNDTEMKDGGGGGAVAAAANAVATVTAAAASMAGLGVGKTEGNGNGNSGAGALAPADKTEVVFVDSGAAGQGSTRREPVRCLFCESVVE